MVTITSDTTVNLNGTTPVVIGGVQHYEWFDRWIDGFFFHSPSIGPVLTVNLTGTWDSSTLRTSGGLGLDLNDDASGGTRRLNMVIGSQEAGDVIELSRSRVETLSTRGGEDVVRIIGEARFNYLGTGDDRDVVRTNSSQWLGTVHLGEGNNRIVADHRGAGIDAIIAGDGNDQILARTSVGMIKSLGGQDTIVTGNQGVGQIAAGDARDRITTNGNAGWIDGGQGNDIVVTGASTWTQSVAGGDDNDRLTIRGEAGLIDGGNGNDTIIGGANWIGTIEAGRGADRVILNRGGVEYIDLGRDADVLIFRPAADPGHRVTVNGGSSVSSARDRDFDAVSFAALGRRVVVDLQDGTADSVQGRLSLREIERVIGGRGHDEIVGNWDDNRLEGGAGRDRLGGGEGADLLIGGAGPDLFIFENVDNRADRIADFSRAQRDRIDLRELEADLDFIGRAGFSGDGPELRWTRGNGQTRIDGDLDGDARGDFTIILHQAMNMREADFLL